MPAFDPFDRGLDHGVPAGCDVVALQPHLDVGLDAGVGEVLMAVDQVTAAGGLGPPSVSFLRAHTDHELLWTQNPRYEKPYNSDSGVVLRRHVSFGDERPPNGRRSMRVFPGRFRQAGEIRFADILEQLAAGELLGLKAATVADSPKNRP